jgi:hypothetical protein
VATASGDERGDFREPGNGGDDADAGYGAANVRTVDNRLDRRAGFGKPVVVPECGPRRDDQDEPRFEKVRGEQQPADDADNQLPVCTFDRRSTRAVTSR